MLMNAKSLLGVSKLSTGRESIPLAGLHLTPSGDRAYRGCWMNFSEDAGWRQSVMLLQAAPSASSPSSWDTITCDWLLGT